ncbi:hypothetical protein B0H63DRAFT_515509 [Podospora didyma]|uniref:Uncharacterized protein n=1 Tax=Podospora didyma TaxID=330526 RepID=A0AAE0K0I3_9PEZI|nr:hypothetical protein B0H63DRAFT_515509 [Podospora didyma]
MAYQLLALFLVSLLAVSSASSLPHVSEPIFTRDVVAYLDFWFPACGRHSIELPGTIEISNVEKPKLIVKSSAFVVFAQPDSPICDHLWNKIRIQASPSRRCRSGLDIRTVLPSQSTVMWLGDYTKWNEDALAIEYASAATGESTLDRAQLEEGSPMPIDHYIFLMIGSKDGLSTLRSRKDATKMISSTTILSTMQTASAASQTTHIFEDTSLVAPENCFLKSTAFRCILAVALTFWRLVSLYGVLEAVVIIFFALMVLIPRRSPSGRNFSAFCAACMVLRDPQYLPLEGKESADIIRRVAHRPGFQTGRLLSAIAVIPTAFVLFKLAVVEGAALVRALGLVLVAPYVFLQLVIVMRPHDMLEQTHPRRITNRSPPQQTMTWLALMKESTSR